ncbi:MAG: glycosyltransferase [Streptosporangiales bacterium]|nr:glycosyltransferase [Streptosporangiales bacterium]
MKIAMVSEHASPLARVGGPDAGGRSVYVNELARAIARKGHHVTVYTRRDDPALEDRVRMGRSVAVEHLPGGPPRTLSDNELLPHLGEFSGSLATRLGKEGPDLIHAHAWMSGVAALGANRELNVPVVQTFHGLGAVEHRMSGSAADPAPRIRMEAALGRSVDAVLATCSDEIFELARMGVPRERADLVPCGVDVDLFAPEGTASAAWPVDAGLRLLTLGRLMPSKGIDRLISAIRGLPAAHLVVAGGPAGDEVLLDPEVRRLQLLAKEYGVSERVQFIGHVQRKEVPRLIRAADVVVCPATYEGCGLVPLEAMACGVPVVATAVGSVADSVVDGTTGELIPPDDTEALAAALRRLATDPTRRTAYGIAGVDRVRSRYSWERVAEETLAAYDTVVGDRRPVAAGR